jgi:hypothetical protein
MVSSRGLIDASRDLHVGHAEAVESLARHWGLIPGGESLATRLREIQEQVRNTYRRLLGV